MINRLLLALIKLYQLCLSPFVGNCCRFYPSCSDYACEALSNHHLGRAGWLIVKRLLKCGPWHSGGLDEVPLARKGGHS
jgi:uncharacterized protein